MNEKSLGRIKQLQAFLRDDENDPFLRFALALEYLNINQPEETKTQFEYLIKNFPEYCGTYFHYGKFLETINVQSAIQMYQKGIDMTTKKNEIHLLKELKEALFLCKELHNIN